MRGEFFDCKLQVRTDLSKFMPSSYELNKFVRKETTLLNKLNKINFSFNWDCN